MPASKAEQLLETLKALLETVPGVTVQRNTVLPEKIPDGGLIILRDGDPGEPEQALGGFEARLRPGGDRQLHPHALPALQPRQRAGPDRRPGAGSAATINAIAQCETRFGTAQGGTPTSLTFSRISQFQGSIKRAGNPVGNLTGGSVTYSNNLEKIETIRDDGLIEGADPTIARAHRPNRSALRRYGTDRSLRPAARRSISSSPIGSWRRQSSCSLRTRSTCSRSRDRRHAGELRLVAGRMLTVTPTNDLDGAAYA